MPRASRTSQAAAAAAVGFDEAAYAALDTDLPATPSEPYRHFPTTPAGVVGAAMHDASTSSAAMWTTRRSTTRATAPSRRPARSRSSGAAAGGGAAIDQQGRMLPEADGDDDDHEPSVPVATRARSDHASSSSTLRARLRVNRRLAATRTTDGNAQGSPAEQEAAYRGPVRAGEEQQDTLQYARAPSYDAGEHAAGGASTGTRTSFSASVSVSSVSFTSPAASSGGTFDGSSDIDASHHQTDDGALYRPRNTTGQQSRDSQRGDHTRTRTRTDELASVDSGPTSTASRTRAAAAARRARWAAATTGADAGSRGARSRRASTRPQAEPVTPGPIQADGTQTPSASRRRQLRQQSRPSSGTAVNGQLPQAQQTSPLPMSTDMQGVDSMQEDAPQSESAHAVQSQVEVEGGSVEVEAEEDDELDELHQSSSHLEADSLASAADDEVEERALLSLGWDEIGKDKELFVVDLDKWSAQDQAYKHSLPPDCDELSMIHAGLLEAVQELEATDWMYPEPLPFKSATTRFVDSQAVDPLSGSSTFHAGDIWRSGGAALGTNMGAANSPQTERHVGPIVGGASWQDAAFNPLSTLTARAPYLAPTYPSAERVSRAVADALEPDTSFLDSQRALYLPETARQSRYLQRGGDHQVALHSSSEGLDSFVASSNFPWAHRVNATASPASNAGMSATGGTTRRNGNNASFQGALLPGPGAGLARQVGVISL